MEKNPAAVALGRLGGKKKVPKGIAKMSEEKRREIAQKGLAARRAKSAESRAGVSTKAAAAPERSGQRMRCAIYARVSTSDQRCEMQLSELRTYCERRGWEIVEEYVDEGWSGKRVSRPALDRLKADSRRRAFDAVLVWKLDRWGRSLADAIAGIQELVSLQIRFVAVTQNIDTDESSPMSRFLLHIMAAFAELEREMIRERVLAGMKQHQVNVSLGRIGKDLHTRSGKDLPVGRPPRIFRRDRALEMRAEGKSIRVIAKELGVPLATIARAVKAS